MINNKFKIVMILTALVLFSCNKNDNQDEMLNNIDENVASSETTETNILENIDFRNSYSQVLSTLVKGSTLVFGKYEQDNNLDNGKEDIEWIVLYKSNKNSMLLLSKYILDTMPYSFDDTECTWNDCDLRKFLNEDFYNEAFDDFYKSFIMENEMTNNKNVNYKTDGGINTVDKVFLLSESQAKKYFVKSDREGLNPTRAANGTAYAKNKGLYVTLEDNAWYNGNSSYWLRTPGVDKKRTEVIDANGSIFIYGENVTDIETGIRPAIWIKY